MSDVGSLLAKLNNAPHGKIGGRAEDEILEFLARCWDQLKGADEGAMTASKLGRAEGLSWNPPILSFTVERHGATVLGSSRAELQYWQVNLRERTAHCQRRRYRQLVPRAPILNVQPIAARVFEAVQEGPASGCDLVKRGIVVWNGDDQISIKHGALVPGGGYAQTVAGRRKRFRGEMEKLMKTIGWELLSVQHIMTFRKS